MYPNLERALGLHERFELLYVVDGWEASFFDKDGDRLLFKIHGKTIGHAMMEMDSILVGYDRKWTKPR